MACVLISCQLCQYFFVTVSGTLISFVVAGSIVIVSNCPVCVVWPPYLRCSAGLVIARTFAAASSVGGIPNCCTIGAVGGSDCCCA